MKKVWWRPSGATSFAPQVVVYPYTTWGAKLVAPQVV